VRFCTFNVHAWCDASGRRRVDETIEVLARARADVVVLNEVLSHDDQALGLVAAALDMQSTFAPAAWGGNAVLTRAGPIGARRLVLHAADGEARSAVLVEVASPIGPLVVIGTHLDHRREAVRVRQVELLLEAVADVQAPHVIAGDFNAMRTSDYPPEVLAAIAARRRRSAYELPSDDVVHRLDAAGYVDAVRLAHAVDPQRPLPSSSRSTCWAGTRVDYVWLDRALAARVRGATAEVVQTDVSDHLPVVVEVQLS
jgi:endonuclease/exonuclease/phosphatase family metal-dependent hydrolase